MLPFKRILFPVDFSDRCSEARTHVAAMAAHFKADLTLLHVVEATPLGRYGVDPATSAAAAYSEMAAERGAWGLNCYLSNEFANLAVGRAIEYGDPPAIIAS